MRDSIVQSARLKQVPPYLKVTPVRCPVQRRAAVAVTGVRVGAAAEQLPHGFHVTPRSCLVELRLPLQQLVS